VPIPGTTKLHRLEENLGAADLKLMPEDLSELDIAASKIPVQGARYPEELLHFRNKKSDISQVFTVYLCFY
jgi:diketogulonate reductase-like aldo/keto reductase